MTSAVEYTKNVLKIFKHPKFVGEIKNPSGVGEVGNPTCILGETLIVNNPRIENIANMEKNDRVLDHNGGFSNVTKTFVRDYNGQIYTLDVWNLGKIKLTPEHNVFATKINRFRDKFRHHKKFYPDWYAASELKKGDYALYPIPKETIDRRLMEFDIPTFKYDFKSKKLPAKIKVDNAFLKLVGFYLAEGHVRVNKCKGTLGFTFGSHEEHYVKETIELLKTVFGLDYSKIYRERNSININCYSAKLARFFEKHFGKGAKLKVLPHWMLLLPKKKQDAIISGLWQGDGYVNGRTAKFVTISEKLAYQTAFLLLRQQILFSFLISPERGMHKQSYSIYIKEQDSLKRIAKLVKKQINFPKIKEARHRSWYSNGYLYVPIRNVFSEKFSGKVYNLEVEPSHSYVSSVATLHNCGDMMTVYIKVKNDRITDIKFKTFGCVAAIAASEALCALAKGKTIGDALKITPKDIANYLGGLPNIKYHCSILGEEALKKAIEDYLKRNA